MKHLKMLGLAVMALGAMMAFASSASAVVTSPAGTEYTSTIHVTGHGTFTLKAGFATITCTTSTIHGTIDEHTSMTSTGPTDEVTFTNCGSATVDTISSKGTLTVTSSGGGKGTLKGTGVEVTTAVFGTSCVYGMGTGTTVGTITGGTPAKIEAKANLPKISGGFLCANPAEWTGAYEVTTPSTLLID